MKKILIVSLLFLTTVSFSQTKFHDWELAKKQAIQADKNILIILTGAQWCKPCVKMEKNVIEAGEFIAYANENLIILEINLPRHFDYDSKVVKDYEHFKNKYQTNALPSMILVNKEGKEITKITSGLGSLEKVMKQLRLHIKS